MSFHHIFQGTVRPVQTFDPEAAADALEKAMKGRGCDKNKVMQIIVGISNGQRQLIREPFKVNFGRDLIETLKKELSGDFEDVIIGLMETPIRYDAIQLKSAMKGLGTRESTLIDILCSRTNAEIEAIKKEYKAEFGTTLEDDIKGDTSGDFQYLLVSLLQAKRDTSYTVSQKQAREDVRLMMGNPAKKEKPDKAQFNAAFCNQNIYQLQKLFSEFQSMIGESIQSVVAKVFSGDAKNAYVLLCDSIESKPRFFSRQLYDAMKGAGTRDKDLIRIIVSRSEIDLALIRDEFGALYKKPLIEWLKAECSGAYRDALIALVNGN